MCFRPIGILLSEHGAVVCPAYPRTALDMDCGSGYLGLMLKYVGCCYHPPRDRLRQPQYRTECPSRPDSEGLVEDDHLKKGYAGI